MKAIKRALNKKFHRLTKKGKFTKSTSNKSHNSITISIMQKNRSAHYNKQYNFLSKKRFIFSKN